MTFPEQNNRCQDNYEKEINILDYAIVVLKHKRMILFAIIITFIIVNTVFYVKWKHNQSTYPAEVAECKISSLLNQDLLNSLIRSYPVINGVLRSQDAMTLLYPHLWDKKEKKWKVNKAPSQEEAYDKLNQGIRTKWDNNVAIVSITGAGGNNIITLLSIYVKELEKYATMKQLVEFDIQEDAINQLLQKTTKDSNDPILRSQIQKNVSEYLIALILEKKRIKNANVISVIDSPRLVKVAEVDPSFITKSYFSIVFISLFIALIISVMLAFFLEYLHDLWNKYPEKVRDLKKLLK